ncbi:MAG: transporter substrate-binding domain-containing protein [Candidatus Cloacimonetes bacterium]|jgi:ABC-type nitrate/sulfonate/bicarbonate transport system substrate-binding protein|nr:transporter substrate-binding domain-containing protein [Candidatus Cloacimonadota bacterium]MDD4155082.1 transporter substrate-binding domain-containing protein [Candidatus Cloacimonadota bacterium]
MKKIFLLAILISLVFSCTTKHRKIRFGIISSSINHLPLSYAIDKNILNINNIKLIRFNTGWELSEALIHNQIDLAILPFTYIWTAKSKGYKIMTVSSFERETDALMTAKNITQLSQLNNKKVGVLRASSLEVLVIDLAKKTNLNFEIVAFRTPNEMIEALRQNQIQAISLYEPLVQKLSDEFHIIKWFSEFYPEHTCCNLASTEIFLTNNNIEDLIEKFHYTFEFIKTNNYDFLQYGVKKFNFSQEQMKNALQHTKYSLEMRDIDKEFELKMINIFLDLGYISNIPENIYYE